MSYTNTVTGHGASQCTGDGAGTGSGAGNADCTNSYSTLETYWLLCKGTGTGLGDGAGDLGGTGCDLTPRKTP